MNNDLNRKEHLNLIRKADKAYYDNDAPIMTDLEYDNLRNDYITKYGSKDLDYVPGSSASNFTKFRHPIPVTSLAKVKANEREKLKGEIQRLLPISIEPKYDGLTIVAYPDAETNKYKFVTRGSGVEGEILPYFVSKYENFTFTDDNVIKLGAIRGEAFITKSDFERLNKSCEEAGENTFVNPRNAAAGILRNKIKSKYIDYISFIAYDVVGSDVSQEMKLKLISQHTPFTITESLKYDDVEEAMEHIDSLYAKHSDGDIPIDGLVIKSNIAGSLGKFKQTNHHPNNAIAYKAVQEGVHTRLLDVEWQLGRKFLTPVAILEPVEILQTMVSKASVHNVDIMRSLDLRIGDTVEIIKANEIIPQITRVVRREPNNTAIQIPEYCPSCGSKLKAMNGQLYCDNDLCYEKMAQNMAYLASSKVLNIRGLSIETCRKIVKLDNFDNNIYSVLGMDSHEFLKLEGFADIAAENLENTIKEAIAEVSFDRYIAALCIPNIGITVGKQLVSKWPNPDDFVTALEKDEDFVEKLRSIHGIGEKTMDIIDSDQFLSKYFALMDYVGKIVPCVSEHAVDALYVVFTGKMPEKRSVYEKQCKEAGYNTESSITKKTNVLVVPDEEHKESSKEKKARDKGIEVIKLSEFLNKYINK